MTSQYLSRPLRPLWKAEADTGRADYFSFTFRHHSGAEYVVSIGKSWRERDVLTHAADADTAEVLIWRTGAPRIDLKPSDCFPLLYPFDRYFSDGTHGAPMACYMQDSILESLLYCFQYYLGAPCASVSKRIAGPAFGIGD